MATQDADGGKVGIQPDPYGHLEPWAAHQVKTAGGDPSKFRMMNGSLVAARAPAEDYSRPPMSPSNPFAQAKLSTEPISNPSAVGSAPGKLEPWAADQVKAGGGDPSKFKMIAGTLASADTPTPTHNLQYQMPTGGNDEPSAGPRLGVQGQQATAGRVGVQGQQAVPADPVREMMIQNLRESHNFLHQPRSPYAGAMTPEESMSYRYHDQRFQNLSEAIMKYDGQKAHYDSQSPAAKVEALRKIATDPFARQLYFAGEKVTDPGMPLVAGQAPVGLPGGSMDTERAGQHLAQNQILAETLGDPNMDLSDRLQKLGQFQGMSDPNHPNHQVAQNWLNRTYTDPAKWQEDSYIPPDPDVSYYPTGLNRAAGFVHALGEQFNPWAEHTAGTGADWHETYRRRKLASDLMSRYGLLPPEAVRAMKK